MILSRRQSAGGSSHEKLKLLATACDAGTEVRKQWGDAALGLALVTKFYSDDPWSSAAQLAEATDLSEDTIRRKLEVLLTIGRVRCGKRGRLTVYKAHRDWAAKTFESLNAMVLAANCG